MSAHTGSVAHQRPYWLYILIALLAVFAVMAWQDGRYGLIFSTLLDGLAITVGVSLVSFLLAAVFGLGLALASLSRKAWLSHAARVYIEVVRGVPTLVILLYITFAGAPLLVDAYQWLLAPLISAGWLPDIGIRDVSNLWRGVLALSVAYSAFLAEVFRAGIQNVDRGQIEAAQSMGFTRRQVFWRIVWPQAVRSVLPALGNDFIALVKDSSLVSVLGVADITQQGKLYASSSFLTIETYNAVAVMYLLLTVSLSLVLRRLERRLRIATTRD